MKFPLMPVAVILLVIGALPARAECPDNTIWTGCRDLVGGPTTMPAARVGPTGYETWSAAEICPTGCYDLHEGVLAANGSATPYGECTAVALVHDEYWIVGPAGPLLSFEAVLRASTTLADAGFAFAGIGQAWLTGGDAQLHFSSSGSQETAIPLTYAPGAVFPVWAIAEGTGNVPAAASIIRAQVLFRGLPVGYSVASCQGYLAAVPVLPATWGRVKALYR